MKLQYFELDKPYVENQQRIEELMDSATLTYEEARIKDYRQNWKDLRRAFVYESKCMTSMVERLLRTSCDQGLLENHRRMCRYD